MEVGDQLHDPAVFPPYPLDRRLGEQKTWSEKPLIPAGNRTPAIQPVAHRLSYLISVTNNESVISKII
jgi:hypothetical protein